jgi:signal transduction histidine kinase
MNVGAALPDRLDLAGASDGNSDDELARLRAENAHLRRENIRLTSESELLRAAARIVVEELDTRVLIQEIGRLATSVLTADCVVVGLSDEDVFQQEACYSYGVGVTKDASVSQDAVAKWVLAHRTAFFSNQPANDSRLAKTGEPVAYRNVLAVPILNHQRLAIGVLQAQNRRTGVFTERDRNAAETLALLASTGLSRAKLYDRMQEWSRSLEMLLAFNAAVNQHLEPKALVEKLVENAAQFLEAQGGMAGLAISSKEGETAMVSESYWYRGTWHERTRRWARFEGLPGTLLENEFSYLSNDYLSDRLADEELKTKFDVRRALSVPIKDVDDRLVGFFELHKSGGATPFSWQDTAFLESLGNTTAVALQNAQLLKTLEIRGREIESLSKRHVTRLEEERARIARELHDEAGQLLIGIKLSLQVLACQISEDAPDVRQELDQLREQVNQATSRFKDLAKGLRPPTLDQLGLNVAIRQLAADHERRTGVNVHLDLSSDMPRLNRTDEIALYRIVQECLTNAAKYASATDIFVLLKKTGKGIELDIRDNGKGFDQNKVSAGLGLLGMRERASMLGAHFEVKSLCDEGTEIQVRVPNL